MEMLAEEGDLYTGDDSDDEGAKVLLAEKKKREEKLQLLQVSYSVFPTWN